MRRIGISHDLPIADGPIRSMDDNEAAWEALNKAQASELGAIRPLVRSNAHAA